MLFNTIEFAFFLSIVLSIYYALSRSAQNAFLVVASYFFYGWWDWRFCGLLAFVTFLNYCCAINAAPDCKNRKAFLYAGIGGSLGALGFFKYYNFFTDALAELFTHFGLCAPLPTLRIILPVGISFYTFQSMAYTIDVYRGKSTAIRDLPSVIAFMTFFPCLLSGPIERAGRMLPQFQTKRTINTHIFSQGILLILIGLFKKIAIADALANETNSVFSNIAETPWPELIGNIWLFAVQIYSDFSGYSDIARGIGCLFGFDISINFEQPYFAANVREFWRRWHISLSNWLRDYVYIPIGGSRRGKLKTYRNIILTMLLCGLWHGAAWTFILWGALHAIFLCLYLLVFGNKKRIFPSKTLSSIAGLCNIIITFNLIACAWLLFHFPTVAEVIEYFMRIISLQGSFSLHGFYFCKAGFFISLMLLIDIPQYVMRSHTAMLQWPWPLQGLMYGMMIILMILLAPGNEIPFIYFQF